MFGKIQFISDNVAHVLHGEKMVEEHDLMNVHVVFESMNQRILGEVTEINPEFLEIRFLGEFVGSRYLNGVIRKPHLSSNIRLISKEELEEKIWQDIKKINKTMPPYKYIREIIITDEPMIKTTTQKIKRYGDNLKK